MPVETRIVAPGPRDRTVRTADGAVLSVPPEWELLPPGDAALTRRLKAAGPTWTVQERVGRRMFSRGVWGPAEQIAALRAELQTERSQPQYQRRRQADAARRDKQQGEYVEDFRAAVLSFLNFASGHARLAEQLAEAVARQATPVGSGTVGRTKRIPIEQRAEAAVIAWLRHQTTAYDGMTIPRVRGQRREVRRLLAAQSRKLLDVYRRGAPVDPANCPLWNALHPPLAAS